MTDHEKSVLESPITISFTKGKGLDVPCQTKIEGNTFGLLIGCSAIVSYLIKRISHEDKIKQMVLLEKIYKDAKKDLRIE